MIRPAPSFDSAQVAQYYDELDELYRQIWGDHIHHGLWITGDERAEQAVRQLVALIAAKACIEAGSRVCDAGSGYGATARMLARRGAEVTAVTLSPEQHAYACSVPAGGRVDYVLGDVLTHPLPLASFNAVIAVESMAHMHDQERFFQRAAELLRPGGRLVVCAWLAKHGVPRWQERYLLEPICREGQLTALGTAAEYMRMVDRSASLQLIDFRDLTLRVRRTWPVFATRAVRRIPTDSGYRRFLIDQIRSDRALALTLVRLIIAYYTGALRYGIFTAEKVES